jgi:hypothetical protein
MTTPPASEPHPNVLLTTRPPGPWPRIINVIVGGWLFVSAFAWPHSAASQTNSWLVGAAVVITALVALVYPALRWFNTALAIWLATSTMVFPHAGPATIWNNLLVALVVFLVSLVPAY